MPTLVLPHRYKPDFNLMWETALWKRWETVRWPLRAPFPALSGDIVLYADPLTAYVLDQETGLRFPEVPLDWLTHVPAAFLQRRVRFGRLNELAQIASDLTGPWFIKPARDKVFLATVYQTLDDPGFTGLDPALPIVVSEPVRFDHEWRFFLGDRTIRAYSIYARNGEAFQDKWTWEEEEEEEALAFMRRVLECPEIPVLPSQVIDIGRMETGWAIIESNDAYASGLYACDSQGVLEALTCSAQRL